MREWQRRVAAEYRSAALTSQVLHWMLQAAMPDPLLRVGLRIVGDELDHADLSQAVVDSLVEDSAPIVLDTAALALPQQAESVLAPLLDAIVQFYCLGETYAVPLFTAMRRHTAHPEAARALDRILRDEVVHRAFGWSVLDALLECDSDGVRQRVDARLPVWLKGFEQSYARSHGDRALPLTPAERALGLLDLDEYAAIYWDCTHGDIARRFEQRGLSLPSTTPAHTAP